MRDSNPRPPACKAEFGLSERFGLLPSASRKQTVHAGLGPLRGASLRIDPKGVCDRFLSRTLAASRRGPASSTMTLSAGMSPEPSLTCGRCRAGLMRKKDQLLVKFESRGRMFGRTLALDALTASELV